MQTKPKKMVDLLEEARKLALSKSAIYQQGMRLYHSRWVKPLLFREGDQVLRLIQWIVGLHKMSTPWEGPFIIIKALSNDAYYLIDTRKPRKNEQDASGSKTERPWNAELLCPFYS